MLYAEFKCLSYEHPQNSFHAYFCQSAVADNKTKIYNNALFILTFTKALVRVIPCVLTTSKEKKCKFTLKPISGSMNPEMAELQL